MLCFWQHLSAIHYTKSCMNHSRRKHRLYASLHWDLWWAAWVRLQPSSVWIYWTLCLFLKPFINHRMTQTVTKNLRVFFLSVELENKCGALVKSKQDNCYWIILYCCLKTDTFKTMSKIIWWLWEGNVNQQTLNFLSLHQLATLHQFLREMFLFV